MSVFAWMMDHYYFDLNWIRWFEYRVSVLSIACRPSLAPSLQGLPLHDGFHSALYLDPTLLYSTCHFNEKVSNRLFGKLRKRA